MVPSGREALLSRVVSWFCYLWQSRKGLGRVFEGLSVVFSMPRLTCSALASYLMQAPLTLEPLTLLAPGPRTTQVLEQPLEVWNPGAALVLELIKFLESLSN